jgi:hypothetical protein
MLERPTAALRRSQQGKAQLRLHAPFPLSFAPGGEPLTHVSPVSIPGKEALVAGQRATCVVAGVNDPRKQSQSDPGAGTRNPPALASLVSALGAIALVLLSRHIRVTGIHLIPIVVPALGALATVLGIVGFRRARQSGSDRAAAQWGLGLGICILIMAVVLGLFALVLSGLPDNGF